MSEEENEIQEACKSYLDNADISDEVVTLRQLQQRRQELLARKNKILETLNSRPNTVTPVVPVLPVDIDPGSTANCDTVSNLHFHIDITTTNNFTPMSNDPVSTIATTTDMEVESGTPCADIDFGSDDSVADPSYVPLSEITNVQPLSPDIDWFPERDTEPELGRASRTRKRKADQQSWKRNKNRKNRMLGKEYIGFKKVQSKYVQNEPKAKRSLGPKCYSQSCLRSKILYCGNITDGERLNIFNRFWSMTWKEKKVFVTSMVDKTATKRKTTAINSRRKFSKEYNLQIDGIKKRVCLKTFLSTLGIKEWTVRYWLGDRKPEQLNTESTNNAPLNNETKRQSVKSYLAVLPKLPSHYCRKSTTKLYLEPIIHSKSELYRMYVDFTKSTPELVASRKLFNDVFAEENIGLFQPKKDACDFCCSYKTGNVNEEAYQKHIEAKDNARSEKSRDKENAKRKSIHVITADLQAVKLCPSLNASALYFKTKLAVHNFTIYNLGTDHVVCYWFNETVCDLKATTYATFFVDYLRNLLETDPKDVIIWSDGCTAQNRNNVLANALLLLAIEKNITITQKYLEKGHTQMEVDSVHSVIERKLKNVEIFLPSQYASITKEARRKPFPYTVEQPDHTFFRDYSAKGFQIYDSIRPGRGVGEGCVVDLRVLKYNPNATIEYKNSFSEDFKLLPRRPKFVSASLSSVPPLYPSKLPIQETKYEHLQQLKSVIPRDCHAFYDNLPYKRR